MMEEAILMTAAVTAAVTGIFMVVWAWVHRPRDLWQVSVTNRTMLTESGNEIPIPNRDMRHTASVRVFYRGSSVAHDVAIVSRTKFEDDSQTVTAFCADSSWMNAESGPLEIEVPVPSKEKGGTYIEIRWFSRWPIVFKAEIYDSRRLKRKWRWKNWWWSIFLRKSGAGRWVKFSRMSINSIPNHPNYPDFEKVET